MNGVVIQIGIMIKDKKLFIEMPDKVNLALKSLHPYGLVPSRLDYALADGSKDIPLTDEKSTIPERNDVVTEPTFEGERLMREIWNTLKEYMMKNIDPSHTQWLEEVITATKQITVNELIEEGTVRTDGSVSALDYYGLLYERGCEILLLLLMSDTIQQTNTESFLTKWFESTTLPKEMTSSQIYPYGMSVVKDIMPLLQNKDIKIFSSPQSYYQLSNFIGKTAFRQDQISDDPATISEKNMPDLIFAEIHPSNAGLTSQYAIDVKGIVKTWSQSKHSRPLHLILDMTIGAHTDPEVLAILKDYKQFIKKGLLTVDIIISLSKSFPQMGSALLSGGIIIRAGTTPIITNPKDQPLVESQQLLINYFKTLWMLNEKHNNAYSELSVRNATHLSSLIRKYINSDCIALVPNTHHSSYILLQITKELSLTGWKEGMIAYLVKSISQMTYRQSLGFNKTRISPIKDQSTVRIAVGLESDGEIADYARQVVKLSRIMRDLNWFLINKNSSIVFTDQLKRNVYEKLKYNIIRLQSGKRPYFTSQTQVKDSSPERPAKKGKIRTDLAVQKGNNGATVCFCETNNVPYAQQKITDENWVAVITLMDREYNCLDNIDLKVGGPDATLLSLTNLPIYDEPLSYKVLKLLSSIVVLVEFKTMYEPIVFTSDYIYGGDQIYVQTSNTGSQWVSLSLLPTSKVETIWQDWRKSQAELQIENNRVCIYTTIDKQDKPAPSKIVSPPTELKSLLQQFKSNSLAAVNFAKYYLHQMIDEIRAEQNPASAVSSQQLSSPSISSQHIKTVPTGCNMQYAKSI
jgi:hypothetical protein